jgi:hypothetical protein
MCGIDGVWWECIGSSGYVGYGETKEKEASCSKRIAKREQGCVWKRKPTRNRKSKAGGIGKWLAKVCFG